MSGRYALDCNLMLCCISCSVLVLLLYLKTGKLHTLLLSGVCFGISLYSYALSYLIIPIFLVLISLYMLYHKKITFPRILLWAVSVCITALPVILFAYTLLFHAEPIHFLGFTISPISGNRMDEISFSSLGANLWNNLKITLTYSIYPMDSVDKFYTLYPVSIPFILLGMLCSVYDFGNSFRTRCFHSGTVYLFYFISCSFVVALTPTDHLYRANSIYICYLFFFSVVSGHVAIFLPFTGKHFCAFWLMAMCCGLLRLCVTITLYIPCWICIPMQIPSILPIFPTLSPILTKISGIKKSMRTALM